MDKIPKKKGFPFGVFTLILFLLLILSAAGAASYFYINVKKGIHEIELSSQDRYRVLADAFAHVAEISYKAQDYSAVKKLITERIHDANIHEAFFVLKDGTIIAHSDNEVTKKLKGNIRNDEFSYNEDIILSALREGDGESRFHEYNIMNNKIPFSREEIKLIKEYLYPKIDVVGWLISRAVKIKEVPLGTVNILIVKNKVYNFMFSLLNDSLMILIGLACISFLVTLIVSLAIYARYRSFSKFFGSLSREQLEAGAGSESAMTEPGDAVVTDSYIPIDDMIIDDMPEDDFVISEIQSGIPEQGNMQSDAEAAGEVLQKEISDKRSKRKRVKGVEMQVDEESMLDMDKPVKDAIPIRRVH